jgi:hypothetical protein
MINCVNWLNRCRRFGLGTVVVLAMATACGSDQLDPSSDTPAGDALVGDSLASGAPDSTTAPAPPDSTLLPADSTIFGIPDSTAGLPDSAPPTDSSGISTAITSTQPGIVFGNFNMKHQYLNSIYTGSMQGLEPSWLMSELVLARSKGARMVLKLVGGSDDRIKNSNGTFSFEKWKALVILFKPLSLTSYINDGTLMGAFLVDEPHNKSKWGGSAIPYSTIEAMAKYVKGLWPSMTTIVRARPTWLAQSTMTYTYLDAGWFQYEGQYMGDVTVATNSEVAAAKRKGLGIVVGLNVLNGGNGSSKVGGTTSGKYKMSATEIRNYGNVLLNQTYACGFFNWTYILGGADYFARTDIKSAMTYLSGKARTHSKTSCRQ